jgi:hypothetical protein
MQAALQDLASTGHNTLSFIICQRVLHNCHEIIFGDLPPPAIVPYASLNLPFQSRFARKKIKAHAEPALVGIGMILAGTPGMPRITEIMGEVAIEQGRVQDEGQEPHRLAIQDDDIVRGVAAALNADTTNDEDNDEEVDDSLTEDQISATRGEPTTSHSPIASDINAESHPIAKGSNVRRRQTIGAAKTSPALPLHMQNIREPRMSDDPLGQNDPPLPIQSASPYRSSPSISSSKHHYHLSIPSGTDFLLQKYDLQSQSHLLRSHYCRSEVCRSSFSFIRCLPNVHGRCSSCSL